MTRTRLPPSGKYQDVGDSRVETAVTPLTEINAAGSVIATADTFMEGASFRLFSDVLCDRLSIFGLAGWLTGGGIQIGLFQSDDGQPSELLPPKRLELTHVRTGPPVEELIEFQFPELTLSRGIYHLVFASLDATQVHVTGWDVMNIRPLNSIATPPGSQPPLTYRNLAVLGSAPFPDPLDLAAVGGTSGNTAIVHRLWKS